MNYFKKLFGNFKDKKYLTIFTVLFISTLNAAEQTTNDAALVGATEVMTESVPTIVRRGRVQQSDEITVRRTRRTATDEIMVGRRRGGDKSMTFIPRGLSDPLAFNPDQPFERVIKLGADCAGKKQINQYFNPNGNWLITKKGHADLFDWMIMHDYDLLADALKMGLSDLFDELEYIEGPCHGAGLAPFNKKYNMKWMHMFHFLNKEQNNLVPKNEQWEGFELEFPKILPKYQYLIQKFKNARQFKTLYFIAEDTRWNKPTSLDILINLRNALIEIRDGNKNFAIVLTCLHTENTEFENIFIFKSTSAWNRGEYYNECLRQFKFAPNIWD